MNATIRQQNELLQQLKDEADHANVLIEERKISIYALKKELLVSETEHNRERTFWMKETVKKDAELKMINDELKIAKNNAELTNNDFNLLGKMFDLDLSSFMNEEDKMERLMKVITKIFLLHGR